MASKSEVPLILEEVDSDVSPDTGIPASLREARDYVWSARTTLTKRSGWVTQSANVDTDGTPSTLSAARHLATLGDEVLVVGNSSTGDDRDVLFARASSSSSPWRPKGVMDPCIVRNDPVGRGDFTFRYVDMAESDTVRLVVADTGTSHRYWFEDKASGTVLVSAATLPGITGELHPRALHALGRFYIIWRQQAVSANILGRYWTGDTPTDVTAAPATVLVAADAVNTTEALDAMTDGNNVYLAYRSTAGGGSIQVLQLNSALTTLATINHGGGTTAGDVSLAWATDNGGGNTRAIVSCGSTTGIRSHLMTLSPFVVGATTILDAAGTLARTITGFYPDASSRVWALYTTDAGVDSFISVASSAPGTSVWQRGVALASRVVMRGGVPYVHVASPSNIQGTVFLMRAPVLSSTALARRVVARILPGEYSGSDGVLNQGLLARALYDSTTDTISTVVERLVSRQTGGVTDTVIGVDRVATTFGHNAKLGRAKEFQGALYFPGGAPKVYDGQTLTEVGFHQYPEAPTVATLGAGNVPANASWRVVARWYGADGRESLSAPSPAVTTSASGSMRVTARTIRVTDKSSRHADRYGATSATLFLANTPDCQLELYRRASDGLYHRVVGSASTVTNNTDVNTVTLDDNLTDAQLLAGEVLYTLESLLNTAQVATNIAPPSSVDLAILGTRPFYLRSERPEIWAGQEAREGFGAEFSDTLVVQAAQSAGALVGAEAMDGRLVVFSERANSVLAGPGADRSGAGQFDAPPAIETQSPLTDPRTLARTPDGIIYRSPAGLRMLSRGLETIDIGAAARRPQTNLDIRAAVVDRARDRAVFLSSTGVALCYTWRYRDRAGRGRWTTWTNHACVDAIMQGTLLAWVTSGGAYRLESLSTNTDDGTAIQARIETNWISLAGLGARSRTHSVRLYSDTMSGGTTGRMQFYFDGDASTVVSTDEVIMDSSYPWGFTPAPPWRFEFRSSRHKGESIKFILTDLQHGTVSKNPAYNISALALVVSKRPGPTQVPGSRRSGT